MRAQITQLTDRGLRRAGFIADVVIFDHATIRDTATFFEPHRYPDGIDYVFINGHAAGDAGSLTGGHHGRVITR